MDQAELEALKLRKPLSAIFDELGYKSRGDKRVRWCLCPWHLEHSASCRIDDFKGFAYCFGCGESGDAIDIVMYARGVSFMHAVEMLGGLKPLTSGERWEWQERRKRIEQDEAEQREAMRKRLNKAWAACQPIQGTWAEAYLGARGLRPSPDWTFDLRFSMLSYRGFPDAEASQTVNYGEFPALVAAIRSQGELIGLHRTYLDANQPKKLEPPGDQRNKPKKILGEAKNGLIWLSKPCARIVVGEGIETTRSWLLLHAEKEPETGACSGVSLGNIAGRSVGTEPHPTNSRLRIPNGIPDLEYAAIKYPDEVKEIMFLGDGDSDYAMTSKRLMCALRRAQAQGKTAFRHFAPEGMDFNDVLRT